MSVNEFELLLDRYYNGQCTDAEREWVGQWLAKAQLSNDAGWDRLTSAQKQDYIGQLYNGISQTIASHGGMIPGPLVRQRRRLWWTIGVAASVCFAIVAYFSVKQRDATIPIEWHTVTTSQGQRKQVLLTDGSTVWLQGGGKLVYPKQFTADERVVFLDGEAYFDVNTDPEKSFIVRAGALETAVLGTTFNIEAFAELDKTVVSLLTGKLAVRIIDSAGMVNGEEIVLVPNEVAIFDRMADVLNKSEHPVQGSAADFKSGSLSFNETPLVDVLFRLGRAYGTTISFDKQEAAQYRITANFLVKEPIDDVFKSVARSTGARYHRNGKTIRLDFQ